MSQEEEDAFWTGVVSGLGPPGLDVRSVMTDEYQEEQMPWYDEDLSVWDTEAPGHNTDVQYSYNVGYALGSYGFGVMMFSAGLYAGAQSGYLLTTAVSVLDVTAQGATFIRSKYRTGGLIISIGKGLFYSGVIHLFAYAIYDLLTSYEDFTGDNAPA